MRLEEFSNISEGKHKKYSLEDFLKAPVNRLHIWYKNLESYYRKGPKYIDGIKYDKVLTRASTSIQGVRGFGQGNYRELDALTTNLAREYGYDGVYIENVLNPWLAEKLPQYGYVEVDKHLRDQGNPPCFFKKLK